MNDISRSQTQKEDCFFFSIDLTTLCTEPLSFLFLSPPQLKCKMPGDEILHMLY